MSHYKALLTSKRSQLGAGIAVNCELQARLPKVTESMTNREKEILRVKKKKAEAWL